MKCDRFALTDLHLHLDGSLSLEVILELAQKCKSRLPADTPDALVPFVSVPRECKSLEEYLKCFSLPLELLQTRESLFLAAYDLVKRLESQGLLYAEIRFAPQFHLQNGMTQEESVLAVLEGISRATEEGTIMVRLILCCMRGDQRGGKNKKANMETVETAAKYLGRGVAALDLAGAEGLYPTADYAEEFEEARRCRIPFTIHAGEAAGPESIWKALEFGAQRIGHGVRALEDKALIEELKKRAIPLEMCPISNLQTKAAAHISSYPLRTYLEYGIPVTVNSDNMTVSCTSAGNEFRFLEETYGLSEEEAYRLARNGAEAAFLPEKEKEELKRKILEIKRQGV